MVLSRQGSRFVFIVRLIPSVVTSWSSIGRTSLYTMTLGSLMTQKFRKQMSGPQVFPAKIFHWREWGRDLDLEEANLDSFMNLCASFEDAAQEPLSSKTSTAYSLATEDETSQSYSRRWTNSGMVLHGVCLTVRTSEFPSNAVASTLLQCIEAGEVPGKYFLSQNAAIGILRRVDQMGRNLPPSFRKSLEILAEGRS